MNATNLHPCQCGESRTTPQFSASFINTDAADGARFNVFFYIACALAKHSVARQILISRIDFGYLPEIALWIRNFLTAMRANPVFKGVNA